MPSGQLRPGQLDHHDDLWRTFLAFAPAEAAPTDTRSLGDLLEVLSLDVLCEDWRAVSDGGAHAEGDGAARSELRHRLLAELRRRDPAGTAHWLSVAPEALPDPYAHEAQDREA